MKSVRNEGCEIGNSDCTSCLQRPKIKDMRPQMQKTIAEVAGIQIGQISVKATTTEKLGFVGREEGVSAYAVVLLEA